MINWKIIAKILGSLLFMEASFMALCLVMTIIYGEADIPMFITSTALTMTGAFLFRFWGHEAENSLSRRHWCG